MKIQGLRWTIVSLVLLVFIPLLFSATPEIMSFLGTHGLNGRGLDLASLAALGPCGFGQMAFLIPLGGFLFVGRKQNRASDKGTSTRDY